MFNIICFGLTIALCAGTFIHDFNKIENDYWIQDPTSILSTSHKDKLNELLDKNSHFKQQSYPCGESDKTYQIGVAITDKMEDTDTSRDIHVMDYATNVFNRMELGHSECNNGILLFVSFEDREIAILRGEGIKSRIQSSADIDSIIDHISPFLKKDEKFAGLYNGLLKITKDLISKSDNVYNKGYPTNDNTSEKNESHFAYFDTYVITICILIVLYTSGAFFDTCEYNTSGMHTFIRVVIIIVIGQIICIIFITLQITADGIIHGAVGIYLEVMDVVHQKVTQVVVDIVDLVDLVDSVDQVHILEEGMRGEVVVYQEGFRLVFIYALIIEK